MQIMTEAFCIRETGVAFEFLEDSFSVDRNIIIRIYIYYTYKL